MQQDQKIFTPNFIKLFIANLLLSVSFMMLMPVLPLFAVESLFLDEGRVGLVVSFFSITALMSRPLVGYMLDNYNRKIILIISMLVFTAVIATYNIVATFFVLLMVRMAHGVTWSFTTTSASTLAADIIPERKRAEAIGYYSLSMPLALAIGPATGMMIFERTGNFDKIITICAVLSLLAVGFAFFIKLNRHPVKRVTSGNKKGFFTLFEKRAMGLAAMLFFYSFNYAGIVAFLPLLARKLNVANSGIFFLIYASGVIISRLIVGKSFDLRGPTRLIVVGYSLFSLGCLTLAFADAQMQFFIAGALNGLGAGIIMPTLFTMALNVVEPENRERSNATIFIAMDIGMGVGALVLGYIIQHTSYQFTYILSAVLALFALLFYFKFEKSRYEKHLLNINK